MQVLSLVEAGGQSKLAEEKRLSKLLHLAQLKLSQPKKSKKKDRKASSVAMDTTLPPTINPNDIVFPEVIPELV